MNKKMILGGVTILSLALAPLGVKSMIDKSIDLKKGQLESVGVLLSIENSKGYLNTTRDFTITINDEVKFKEYFKNILIEENPVYELAFASFENNENKKFDEFLKGIVFKGNIDNSNINPSSDIKVYTYLDSFSNKIMEDIKSDKEASEIILPLFEKEALAFNMLFDSSSKLKVFSLKDINENIKSTTKNGETSEGIFQILGHNATNNSTDKKIIADMKVDKINMSIKSKKNVDFNINDLKFNVNYLNQFVNSGKTEIGSINLGIDNDKKFILENTKIDSLGKVTNGVYSANSKISASNFKLIDEGTTIGLNSLGLNLYLDNIDYENLKKLNEAYMNFESVNIKSMTLPKNERLAEIQKATEPLLSQLNSLINKGLSIKIDAKLLGLIKEQLNLKNVKLDVNAMLDKNDMNIQGLNQLAILGLLNVNAKLEMNEEDFVNLSSVINPNFAQIATMYAKRDNGKVLFDIDLKKGKIEVNGQKVN